MAKSIYTPSHKIVIDTLIKARKDVGVYQENLAEKIGKSQPFVSTYERGQRNISFVEFVVIARALGYDPAELAAEVIRQLPADIEI
ncbi:MAG: helix-turn-helix transcriptional regulator [Asticcacaulis sp.]